VLAGYVRAVATGSNESVASEVERLLALIDREIRVLHADYLARIRPLAGVIAECRGPVDRRLAAAAHQAAA
jgi:hypothetical protein